MPRIRKKSNIVGLFLSREVNDFRLWNAGTDRSRRVVHDTPYYSVFLTDAAENGPFRVPSLLHPLLRDLSLRAGRMPRLHKEHRIVQKTMLSTITHTSHEMPCGVSDPVFWVTILKDLLGVSIRADF